MTVLLIGYARVSTDGQDLTAQREGLQALGVPASRVYVDHGLTGTNRDRPGLKEAMAACREGDTLVVTKLDRLARSLPDARSILEELTTRQVRLSLGGSVHDPLDPVGRLLFNVLAGTDRRRVRRRHRPALSRPCDGHHNPQHLQPPVAHGRGPDACGRVSARPRRHGAVAGTGG